MRPEELISAAALEALRAHGWEIRPAAPVREVREAVQFALFLHLGNDANFSELQFVANDILGRLVALGLLDPDL